MPTRYAWLLLLPLLVGCQHPWHRHARGMSEVRPSGNSVRGAQLYQQHCAACHGATGEGLGSSVDPSLIGLHTRMSLHAITDAIMNPTPLMPKLYPVPLSQRDVMDLSAYVATL